MADAAIESNLPSPEDDADSNGIFHESPGCTPLKSIDMCSYKEVSFETACSQYPHFKHAAHCMIYAFDNRMLWKEHNIVANVMMQVRFDGTLGFSGGYIDAVDDTIVTGLNRELVEELNFDVDKHRLTQNNHLFSHVCDDKKLVTHFYGLEVTNQEYHDIEKRTLTAHEWGLETLGILRVPLYSYKDNVRGFPIFLTSKFVGNSKQQLLSGLEKCRIMSSEDIMRAVGHYHALVAATVQCGI